MKLKLRVRRAEGWTILAVIAGLIALLYVYVVEHSDLKPNSMQFYAPDEDDD
jgi:hypothetical protein